MIAGQGTAVKELLEEVPDLDYLFVCLGGGGLLSGSLLAANALARNCQVIGVEPEAGNDVQQSLRADHISSDRHPAHHRRWRTDTGAWRSDLCHHPAGL